MLGTAHWYGGGCASIQPPNGLGISGGAPIDRESGRTDSVFKNAPILRAHSAVRCMPLLGALSLSLPYGFG
jgi:hypothetical protein